MGIRVFHVHEKYITSIQFGDMHVFYLHLLSLFLAICLNAHVVGITKHNIYTLYNLLYRCLVFSNKRYGLPKQMLKILKVR